MMDWMTHKLSRWLFMAVTAFAFSPLAIAQTLPATSDGSQVWLVKRADGGIVISHRDVARESSSLRNVAEFQGQLAPGGFAAGHGSTWLVYQGPGNLLFQSISLVAPRDVDMLRHAQVDAERALSGDVQLWSLAVTESGPWALLRARSAAGMADIDDALASDGRAATAANRAALPALKNTTSPVQPATTNTLPDAKPESVDQSSTDVDKPATTTHTDRLVALKFNRWVDGTLPADWPEDARKWLVTRNRNDTAPLLVALLPARDGTQQLRVYEMTGQSWRRSDYELAAMRDMVPVAVDGQLLLATVPVSAEPGSPELAILGVYPERIYPIGSLGTVPTGGSDTWTVLPVGATVALVQRNSEDTVDIRQIDLDGKSVQTVSEMQADAGGDRPLAGYLVIVGCLAIGSPLIFYYWRRMPDGESLTLPKDVVPSDMMRRIFAVCIDFAPAVFLVMKYFDISFVELIERMPARDVPLEQLTAPVVMVALFVLHTTISEAITGRTLGKMALGLRVMRTDGATPKVWQILVRNVLKIIEVFGWPLAFAPIMRPIARQRLGDLAAGTVVVAPAEPEEEDRHD